VNKYTNKILAMELMAVLVIAIFSIIPVYAQNDKSQEGDDGNDMSKEHKGKSVGKDKDKAKEKSKEKGKDKSREAHTDKSDIEKDADKKSMAIAHMKIALSGNSDSTASGFAKLMLKIVENKEPVLRVDVHVVLDGNVSDTLNVCMDEKPVGKLTIKGSEEGKMTGRLKANISNATIQLPGVDVSVVDGECGNGNVILAGTI
jgi:hypothetical protein